MPANTDWLFIYSKVPVEYGYIVLNTKYPDWTGWGYDNYVNLSTGFALGGTIGWDLLRVNQNSLDTGIWAYQQHLRIHQSVSLPPDYLTAKHSYWVKINKHQIWFGVDSSIRGFVLPVKNAYFELYQNSKPYTIITSHLYGPESPKSMFAYILLLNLRKGGQHPGLNLPDFTPFDVDWAPGDPLPPLSLPLFVEASDTRLAGQSISTGSIISHPIPVFGYRSKTLYFMANQSSAASGLVLEVYTLSGNWRTYDAITYTAGKLLAYQIAGDALVARLTYTPAAYPATINEAEAVLTP